MKYLILLLLVLSLFPTPTYAAKKRIRKAPASTSRAVAYSSVRLNRATNSLGVTFMNLDKGVSRAGYTLSYSASGIEQGAGGSITPSGSANESRDLYFGTCSHGVCTPHRGIKNAQLIVTISFAGGGSFTKRYRIKV